jgi:hypothetical protein
VRRLVWTGVTVTLGVGIGLGLAWWAYRRFDAAKRAVSPEGIAGRVDDALASAHGIVGEIRQAAQAREAELRRALFAGEN